MVIDCNELHQQRRASKKNGKVSVTRAWMVTCDNPLDGPIVAMQAEGIPREGNPLTGHIFAPRVTSVDADPVNNSDVVFIVIVQYEGVDGEAIPTHPLDRAPEYQWGADSFTEPYFYDESKPNRKPFVNAAGDPFDSQWERAKSDLTIILTRNEPIWDVLAIDHFKDSVNEDAVTIDGQIYGPGTLLLGPVTAQKSAEDWMGQPIDFYRVTYPFKARRNGWKDKPLNYGLQQLKDTLTFNPDGSKIYTRIPIMDGAGKEARTPWPLDLAGKAMKSATDIPPELEFLPYKEVAWAPLFFS